MSIVNCVRGEMKKKKKKKSVTSVVVKKESDEEVYNTVLGINATCRPMHRMGRISAVGSRNECSQHSSASSHWSQVPDYDKSVQSRVQQLELARYLPRSGIDKLAIVELLSLTDGSGASPQSISDTSKQAPISDMNDAAGITEHLNMEGYQASFCHEIWDRDLAWRCLAVRAIPSMASTAAIS